MLNGYQGSINFKEKMLADLNSAYKAGLEDYLNKEVLLQSKNIVYKYNNFTVTFMNIVYDCGGESLRWGRAPGNSIGGPPKFPIRDSRKRISKVGSTRVSQAPASTSGYLKFFSN
jgi:hypothetical protein